MTYIINIIVIYFNIVKSIKFKYLWCMHYICRG